MVAKVFFDVNMGLGIPGLNALLKENRVAVRAAPAGTMFMFLNRKRTQVKFLWNQNMMLHFRKEDGEITIEELKKIPGYFKSQILGGRIEAQLSKAISQSVQVSLDEEGLKVG